MLYKKKKILGEENPKGCHPLMDALVLNNRYNIISNPLCVCVCVYTLKLIVYNKTIDVNILRTAL